MVNIYNLADTALGTLNLPFYYGMPSFDETNPEPECYLVYEDVDRAKKFADGKRTHRDYNITVNIFKFFVDFDLQQSVISALEASGFTYINGGKIGKDTDFPFLEQYYQEFIITIKEN